MKDALDTSDRSGIDDIGETFLYFARELLGNGEIQLCSYASVYLEHSQTASNPIAYIMASVLTAFERLLRTLAFFHTAS